MKVSIVIPVYNQMKMTIDCLRDVLQTCGTDIEVIVVDDCSKEKINLMVTKLFPGVKVFKNDENLGFAKTVNRGIQESTGDYICLLNNDIRLPNANWLKAMIDSLQEFDMTAPAGGRMDSNWNYITGEAKTRKDKFSYLVGWCLLMKRSVIDKIGLISEGFGKGFFEDVEYSYRARKAGLKLGITEGTQVQHLYHATFKAEGYNLSKEYQEKRKIFLDMIKKG